MLYVSLSLTQEKVFVLNKATIQDVEQLPNKPTREENILINGVMLNTSLIKLQKKHDRNCECLCGMFNKDMKIRAFK